MKLKALFWLLTFLLFIVFATPVYALQINDTDLIAFYDFAEADGNITDKADNHLPDFTMYVTGSPTYQVPGLANYSDFAIDLDGVDDLMYNQSITPHLGFTNVTFIFLMEYDGATNEDRQVINNRFDTGGGRFRRI